MQLRSAPVSTRPPIVQYWHHTALPEPVVGTLRSFREHTPDHPQLIFSAATAEELIADRFEPRQVSAFRACAVPTMQSDYFRYCAVYALGGVYVDANAECLSSLSPLIGGPSRGVLFGRQDPLPQPLVALYRWPYPVGPYRAVPNGLFGFREPGHPFLELAIEVATANIEHRIGHGSAGIWLAAGPGVFTSMYLLRELGSFDAFVDYSRGSIVEPSAALFCEVVGDYDRIVEVFDGVEIVPEVRRDAFAIKTMWPAGSPRWHQVDGDIYR